MLTLFGDLMLNKLVGDLIANVHWPDSSSEVAVVTDAEGSRASVSVRSPSGADASATLRELGGGLIIMRNEAKSGKFIVTGSSGGAVASLFEMTRGKGDIVIGGNLTIGCGSVNNLVNNRTLAIRSRNSTALRLGSVSGYAGLTVKAPYDATAAVVLSKMGVTTTAMMILSKAASNDLIISDGSTELASLSRATGAFSLRGSVVVGGVKTGGTKGILRSTLGSSWMPPTRLDSTGRFNADSMQLKSSPHLKACFATRDSLGDASTDFVELNGTVLSSTIQFGYNPRIKVIRLAQTSGPHLISIVGASPGDEIQFQKGACSTIPQPATPSSTNVALVSAGESSAVIFVATNLDVGNFNVCVRRPHAHIAQTVEIIPDLSLVIVAKPIYFPTGSLVGTATDITFVGASVGDYIVMQPDNCTSAFVTSTSSNSLGLTQIGSSFQISKSSNITWNGLLQVCYATFESKADSADDFVTIGTRFMQSAFSFEV